MLGPPLVIRAFARKSLLVSEIRVRIAPSPTGFLHVGTARTALFNYLFAKGQGGKFILRIEDTDLERSQEVYTQNIFDSLQALGLTWDEGPDVGGPYGPYRQTERLDIYREWAEKLQKEGKAYYCYCTEAELTAEREKATDEKRDYLYSRRCCDAATAETLKQDPARKPTLRFKVPAEPKTITVQDHIRGDIPFESALIGDFVILKSNGTPSYNFAVVVDDIMMKISHVIRGEDHISNTPKQMMVFEAFGAKIPEFAHVGMILAPDRSKLSKRHGATAVSDFIKQGYLPEAFCNFLALLGWAPQDGEEVGSLQKFAQEFTLERIVKHPAVFDKDKLNWLNGMYIRELSPEDLAQRAKPYLSQFNLAEYSQEHLALMLEAVRKNLVLLEDLPSHVDFFFGADVVIDPKVFEAVLLTEDSRHVLLAFEETFLHTCDFHHLETLSGQIHEFPKTLSQFKTKIVMWAIRAALTGRTHGADMSKVLFLLGKDKCLHRVKTALSQMAQQVS